MHIQIQDRALLKVSGGDAESFLQAQLTNDITLLDHKCLKLLIDRVPDTCRSIDTIKTL